MKSMPSISICAPAHNEAQVIDDALNEMKSSAESLNLDYEIVITDDGSTDGTSDILSQYEGRWDNLRVVKHSKRKGIADSFNSAYRASSKELIFHTAADGQCRCSDIGPMLEKMMNGAEIVGGYRPNKSSIYSPTRRLVSYLYQNLVEMIFKVEIRDPGNIRLAPREFFIRPVISRGVFCDAERLILAHLDDKCVAYVQSSFYPRQSGKASGASIKAVYLACVDFVRVFWQIKVLKKIY